MLAWAESGRSGVAVDGGEDDEETGEEDARADVFGDAMNETLSDGSSKAEVMKDFMWEDKRTELEKQQDPTVPWWAGRRVVGTAEFEPDLQRDPNSWFEERTEPAPFESVETAIGGREAEAQYDWAKAANITEVRRPHMRREAGELSKRGEPRVAHTDLKVGQVFRDVPIASQSWNIGVGIDVGADYDAGVLFLSTAWDDELVQRALAMGAKVDVRVTHVRDPRRYIWALECELLGMDDVVSRLPLLGYPLLHIRPEDQSSLDGFADIIEAAGRKALIHTSDATERAKDRTNYMKRSVRGTLYGDPHEAVSFAEDYEEVELVLDDPTAHGFDMDDVEFHRARNAYFVHRYLWETGEALGSDCPDFMFRNTIPGGARMHPDEHHWSHEEPMSPQRRSKQDQYPLAPTYSFWRRKDDSDGGREKRAARPYQPSSPLAQRFKRVGIGSGFLRESSRDAALHELRRSRFEASVLADDAELPFDFKEEHVELLKDAIVMRRRIRRDVAQNPGKYAYVLSEDETAGVSLRAQSAIIEDRLEPQFETEVDMATGEVKLKRVVDVRPELEDASIAKDDDSDYDDVVRFTERDLEFFVDIDDLNVEDDE